jgi:hypothetical protein
VSVDSEPPGATAFVNGVKLDKVTPADPHVAPSGPLYISFQRRNFAPSTIVFEHEGPDPATARFPLLRYPGNPIAPINRARTKLEKGEPPTMLKEAAGQLGVEMLVLMKAARYTDATDRKPKLRIVAWLYDARVDKVLKRAERSVSESTSSDAADTARFVARDAVTRVRLDGVDAPFPEDKISRWDAFSKKAREDFGKFYRWKGFWWVVGGASAALVITVVGASAGMAEHRKDVARDVILIGGN